MKNALTLLLDYLKTYFWAMALYIAVPCVFVLLHLLGGGGVAEIRYAVFLCCLMGALAFAAGLFPFARKRRALMMALAHPPVDASHLPMDESPLGLLHHELDTQLFDATRRSRSALAQQQRENEEYFTLWLHQMKTPLAALDLMAQSDLPIDRAQMRQELLKARQYADMALTYQRLPSMSRDLCLTQTALYPLVCACVRQLHPLFRYGQLQLDMEPFDGMVLTDGKWLSVVVSQVLTNALKYTQPGGVIRIRYLEGNRLEISDTGIGIRPEDVPRVFERGFTGFSGRAHEKSTGIGLYLCKEIMRRLGHGIRLTSEVGEGTVVTLDLMRHAFVDMG